jgi:acyl-CoA thioester hydrolase
MSFTAPFARFEGEVRAEWIDINGHMNLAYYVVLFDLATDALFDAIDIGRGYKERTGCGTFVAEMHTLYRRELFLGERVRVSSQILGADEKRLHLAHEMRLPRGGENAAMQELLFLHVDLETRRVAPFPAEAQTRVDAASAAHAPLPRPLWVGRRIRALRA